MNPKAKMKLIELKDKLSAYKSGYTAQNWRKDNDFSYENDYIKVLRLDSSNVSGGSSVHNGKQWSIIVDIKKPFTNLENWKRLCATYKNELSVTKVNRGILKDFDGIRFYNMSKDPTNEIIKDFLDYIFEQ